MGRSTIEFNDAADAQLAYLAGTLGVRSKAEVVRNALSLYTYLVQLLERPDRSLGILSEAEGAVRIEKVIVVPGMQAPVPASSKPREKEAALSR